MYVSWKLDWSDPNYGIGPEDGLKKMGTTLHSKFLIGNPTSGRYYGELDVPVSLDSFSQWDIQELDVEEYLEAAATVNQLCEIKDGVLVFGEPETAPKVMPEDEVL